MRDFIYSSHLNHPASLPKHKLKNVRRLISKSHKALERSFSTNVSSTLGRCWFTGMLGYQSHWALQIQERAGLDRLLKGLYPCNSDQSFLLTPVCYKI